MRFLEIFVACSLVGLVIGVYYNVYNRRADVQVIVRSSCYGPNMRVSCFGVLVCCCVFCMTSLRLALALCGRVVRVVVKVIAS
mgnify:CR=1 FL=1